MGSVLSSCYNSKSDFKGNDKSRKMKKKGSSPKFNNNTKNNSGNNLLVKHKISKVENQENMKNYEVQVGKSYINNLKNVIDSKIFDNEPILIKNNDNNNQDNISVDSKRSNDKIYTRMSIKNNEKMSNIRRRSLSVPSIRLSGCLSKKILKQRYMEIIELSNAEKLFENYIEEIFSSSNNFDDYILLSNSTYGKNLNYKVSIKEETMNKTKTHKVYQECDMKVHPLDYFNYEVLETQEMENIRKKEKKLWQDLEVKFRHEKNGIKYQLHRVYFRPVLMMKPKETYILKAIKELENGDWIQIYQSYDDPCPNNEFGKSDVLSIIKGYIYFKNMSFKGNNEDINGCTKNEIQATNNDDYDHGLYRVINYHHVIPLTKIPQSIIKGFIKKFYEAYYCNVYKNLEIIQNTDYNKMIELRKFSDEQ